MSSFSLTPFQRTDLATAALANGCILAWDTGLGKSLALFLWPLLKAEARRQAAEGKFQTLLVAPADLHDQLRQEASRFNITLHPISAFCLLPSAIYLASYTCLHTVTHLAPDTFSCIVLDEATRIKNANSRITRSLNHFTPRYRLAVTATPVKNRLADLYPILKWVSGAEAISNLKSQNSILNSPAIRVPSSKEFRSLYLAEESAPGRNNSKFKVSLSILSDNEHRLALELAPWLITRTKSQAGVPIVPRHISIIRVPMGRRQARAYAAATSGPIQIGQIQELRSIAAGDLSKFESELKVDSQQPSTLFTPKLRVALILVDCFLTLNETALIFSPLRAPLDALSARLHEAGVAHAVLDGRTAPAERARIIAKFKTQSRRPAGRRASAPARLRLLLCGECMSDGHSFPATRNIVLLSPFLPWDKFKQSLDRIHRLNSEQDIRVHVLLAEGTIEERLHARTQEKTRTNNLAESLNPPLKGEEAEEGTGVAETILEIRFPMPESDLDEHHAETTIWPMLLRSLWEEAQGCSRYPRD